MAGTIAIQEDRNKLEQFREKFKEVYQEKVIDTGISEGVDKVYGAMNDVKTFVANTAIRVTGTAGTIAAAIFPADGPVGEVVVGAITVALPVAIKAVGELDTKIMTGAKDIVETKIIGVEKPEQEKEKIIDMESIKELKNQLLDKKEDILEAIQKQREMEQENDAPRLAA